VSACRDGLPTAAYVHISGAPESQAKAKAKTQSNCQKQSATESDSLLAHSFSAAASARRARRALRSGNGPTRRD